MLNSSAMISRDGATIDDANGSRNDRAPMQAVALSFCAFGQHRGSFVLSPIMTVVSPFSISTWLGIFSDSTLQLPLPLSLSCDFLPSDIISCQPTNRECASGGVAVPYCLYGGTSESSMQSRCRPVLRRCHGSQCTL